jgi:hypothetical protein
MADEDAKKKTVSVPKEDEEKKVPRKTKGAPGTKKERGEEPPKKIKVLKKKEEKAQKPLSACEGGLENPFRKLP